MEELGGKEGGVLPRKHRKDFSIKKKERKKKRKKTYLEMIAP